MFFVFILLILLAVFLEGSVTTLPLVLLCLLCLTIYKRESIVFLVAFLAGLILDLLKVNTIGTSSLFFVSFVFLIFLYQRKYEINSYQFVTAASFLGSLGYLGVFEGGNLMIQSFISSAIAIVLFGILRKLRRSEIQTV